MIYQIAWEDKDNVSRSKTLVNFQNYCPNRKIAIATLFSFQLTAMTMLPMFSHAEPAIQTFDDDVPEEVLRAEIYTNARSPIDGAKLTAAEYVELMENLRSLDNIPPEDLVSPKIREVINLLKLRKFLRQIIPFIP